MPSPPHALTLLVWALAAAATAQIAPNPVYAAVIVACAALLVRRRGARDAPGGTFRTLLALTAVFVGIRVLIAVLTVHGTGDAALSLPDIGLPGFLGGYTIGGTVEWPVVRQAVAEGVVVVAVVAVFAAFNTAASHYELIQVAPRAFHEPGLVLVVALAFVPSTIGAFREVRLADRARTGGTRVRRGRTLRHLVPVLETGMEKAMALAESMDSRGFGHGRAGGADTVAAWTSLVSLLALASALVALVGRAHSVAAALVACSVTLVIVAVVCVSRSHRRQRHRPTPVTRLDVALMGTAVAVPVSLALLGGMAGLDMRWHTAAQTWPRFDPVVAAVILGLAIPALVPAPTREPGAAT
ncbi:MAG: hypothetical protein IT198_11245 [Acidimicrobiia bacterium]|nr:hypothetical protein [Acidimicrobiia bacterium]